MLEHLIEPVVTTLLVVLVLGLPALVLHRVLEGSWNMIDPELRRR